jgi:flagellar biosynthesis/type III secretory pathway protein FliH
MKLKINGNGFKDLENPNIWYSNENSDVKQWLSEGNTPDAEFTAEELAQQIEDAKPKVVTMRQARLALLQSGLLTAVETAIVNGTDEAMKIEWEYATEVRRDWASLIALTTELGLTSLQLDDLFILADTL